MKSNVLLVWDRMGDYHRARWEALQKEFQDRKVYAADLGKSDNLYGWTNTDKNPLYVLLSEKPPDKFDLGRLKNFIRILSGENIGTICISGYGKLEYLMFILYGRITGRRVILFAESWYPSSGIVDTLKSIFLNFSCDGFLVSGSRAFNHFSKRLKIAADKIKIGYSVVDNEHFTTCDVGKFKAFEKRLLCVARFAPEKNLKLLLTTFLRSDLVKENWTLHIVGGGPLKSALEGIVGNSQQVKLMMWKSYQDLPALYHNADVFILPSIFEPWGLVVNEAMASGLPLILSDEVGCVPDLLEVGQNGWHFPLDENKLLQLLNSLAEFHSEVFHKMGERSRQKISTFSLQTFSGNLKMLIERG